MELPDGLMQLKESLGKYAKSRVFHIGEAAEELKVTEKYLIDLARKGKIKAFKIGEHWFLEEDWVNDFRKIMKNLLHEAVAIENELHGQRAGWSRNAKRSFNFRPVWRLSYSVAIASVVLAVIGVSFSFMMLPIINFSLHRQETAKTFLAATYQAYGYPIKTVSNINIPINDEKLTGALYSLMGKKYPGQACPPALGGAVDCGRVAGAYEFKLEE